MAKRDMTMDGVEERVVAFSEQLGRVVGTVQAKAEGWLDRDALRKQLASIRDNAADLLEHLAGRETAVKNAVAKVTSTKGRSGGVVDAPGKKHRKPMPKDSRAIAADAHTSTMRGAKPMAKTTKLRGRG